MSLLYTKNTILSSKEHECQCKSYYLKKSSKGNSNDNRETKNNILLAEPFYIHGLWMGGGAVPFTIHFWYCGGYYS